ncbi:chromate transporter [Aliiruegeria haliotis]|uniref:Chromate transporter n=2 Tax=Aliiruegeria haliotis TaxID=1280846 RepID=A0A2T0RZZ9_9RHOB|nr:chromate transporter [Aliiruegeria haliotis]
MGMDRHDSDTSHAPGDIFLTFLALGLTSFGGPVAHLGYFRTAFVERRKWLSDAAYADLVALCQFLPGPASSQVGFALGLMRGGWPGALAAWAGFTLPSAMILVLFAWGAAALSDPFSIGVIAGLKVLAVAVVADAVYGMGRSLCPDRKTLAIALLSLAALGAASGTAIQVLVILAGAVLGLVMALGAPAGEDVHGAFDVARLPDRRVGLSLVALAFVILVLVPLALQVGLGGQGLALFDAFYRAGALVFGGGHVVLPLLQDSVVGPGWTDPDTFLTGYGAAQAVPGPLFTFAAYLGSVLDPAPNGLAGATIALVAIFLPGALLVAGMLPWWDSLRSVPRARAALAGVNAAVVGILAAALYDPVFTSGVRDGADFALAATGFFALRVWKVPVWVVVICMAVIGGAMGISGL